MSAISSDAGRSSPSLEDRRYLLAAAGLVLLSVVATIPIVEMGINDDWSYVYTTERLAATGHWHFTGWGSPMIGIQALVGALAIRAIGFSFTLLRFTTSLFAVGCALLVYKTGRLFGLKPSFALFGALAVTLSPVFIPCAASFMTDVPGFFFLLACFYCAALALCAKDRTDCIRLLVLSSVAGFLGGTVRQVIWGLPLLMIPAFVWLKREDRPVVRVGVVLWAASAAGVVLCLRWLGQQAYFVPESAPANVDELIGLIREMRPAATVRTTLILMLPALVIHVFGWLRVRHGERLLRVAAVFGLLWPVVCLPSRSRVLLGDVMTPYGLLLRSTEALGIKPVVLPNAVFFVLASLALCAAIISVAVTMRGPVVGTPEPDAGISPRSVVWLVAPFCVSYMFLLVYRTGLGFSFDRHLILVLPVFTLPLLVSYQRRVGSTLPIAGWIVLLVMAVYAVATTHDYFASARARLAAATALTMRGVPRTAITAGFEYDAWTELEARGYLSNPRIRVPATVYKPKITSVEPGAVYYWFWNYTPSIDPQYFVVYTRQASLVDSSEPPVRYTAWLPPHAREVLTQTLPSRSRAAAPPGPDSKKLRIKN